MDFGKASVCRTCLGPLDFPRNLCDEPYKYLLDLLHRLLNFQVNIHGGVFSICRTCEGKLVWVSEFKDLCEKSCLKFKNSDCKQSLPDSGIGMNLENWHTMPATSINHEPPTSSNHNLWGIDTGSFDILHVNPLTSHQKDSEHTEKAVKKTKKKRPCQAPNVNTEVPKAKPPKKRRAANPAQWKRNLSKTLRLKGEEYKTHAGKTVAAKPMQAAPCFGRPKHRCCDKIPEDHRKEIYKQFHSLASMHEQRAFFVAHISQDKPKRRVVKGDSRKEFRKIYTLTYKNSKQIVCREFFLSTLGIGEGLVRGALLKLSPCGVLLPDARGKRPKKGVDEVKAVAAEDSLSVVKT